MTRADELAAVAAANVSVGRHGGAAKNGKNGHRSTKNGSKKRTNDKHTGLRPGSKTKQRSKPGFYQR